MKKLIAISVVFALAAGVAFAVDLGGTVIGGFIPLQGSSEKDSKVGVGGAMTRIRIDGGGQDEEGVFGGWARFDAPNDWGNGGNTYGQDNFNAYGLVWWQPIPQFKLQLGSNPDGHFGADGGARWNFYQVAGDVRVANEAWATQAFYGGFGAPGAILTLTPIDDLAINLALPLPNSWGNNWEDHGKLITAQVAYNIGGIGSLALTFAGNAGNFDYDYDPTDPDSDPFAFGGSGSSLYLYFGLSAIENLGLDIGFKYTLPVTANKASFIYKDANGDDQNDILPLGVDVTYNAPIAIGLAASYGAGAFGVKARLDFQLGESAKIKGVSDEWKGATKIIVDILPSFAITDNFKFYLSAGLDINAPSDNKKLTGEKAGDPVVAWHVEPYVSVKSSWWAPNFYAGIRIESDGVKGSSKNGDASKVSFSVPIGIIASF